MLHSGVPCEVGVRFFWGLNDVRGEFVLAATSRALAQRQETSDHAASKPSLPGLVATAQTHDAQLAAAGTLPYAICTGTSLHDDA